MKAVKILKFVMPGKEYEKKAIEFIQEFYDFSSELNGTCNFELLSKETNFSEWLTKAFKELGLAIIPEEKVPAYTYYYIREEDGRIIGMVNIRLELTEFLRKEGGHIGYCIRPSERKKGYGVQMLSETLELCKLIGLSNIIIVCGKKNEASAKIIQKCGGTLDEEFYSRFSEESVQRYNIFI